MSINRFELTEDHIKLVKNIKINEISGVPQIDEDNPFGGDNLYDDMNLILNGKTREVGPDDTWEEVSYPEEDIVYWDKLKSELATALDVVLCVSSFEPGTYGSRSFNRTWKKVD
jgi:hypothetical protein